MPARRCAPVLPIPRLRPPGARGAQPAWQTKQQIVDQLIAGRFSLPEAAHRFRAAWAPGSPMPADEAGVCRTLIGWAGLALAERPEQAAVVTRRLETELQERLDRQDDARPRND